MSVHSGRFGAIDIAASVRDWTVNDNMTPSEYTVSGSQGAVIRTEGVRAWDGSYNQLVGEPTLLPGELGAAKLYTSPSDDLLGGTGITGNGILLVSETVINWDWSASEALSSAVTFVGDGPLTWVDEIVTDDTIPNPLSVCPTKIETSLDYSIWTTVPNLESAALTLTTNITDYVNSSTNCETKRIVGTKDWTLSLTQQDNVRTGHIDIGDMLYVRCWIDDTLFWDLAYGLVRDFSSLTVNVESGDIINRSINIDGSASNGTKLGGVVAPSGKVWWNAVPSALILPPDLIGA